MQKFGVRLKYIEQYCMSNIIIAVSCPLGSKQCHACILAREITLQGVKQSVYLSIVIVVVGIKIARSCVVGICAGCKCN